MAEDKAKAAEPKVPAAKPVSAPSKPQSDTPNNKKLFMVGGIVVAVLVVLGLIVGAVLLTQGSNNAGGGSLAVDVSNPERATQELNDQLVAAIDGISAQDLNDLATNPNALFSALGNTGEELSNAEFSLQLKVDSKLDSSAIDTTFTGAIDQTDAENVALEGKLVLTADGIPDVGAIKIDLDVVMVDQVLYLRINTLDAPGAGDQVAFIAFLIGDWISIDLDQASELAGGSTGIDPTSQQDSLDELRDLSNTWKNNPPFINPAVAEMRTVASKSLECMTVELNPAAFNSTTTTATTFPDMEICSAKGGEMPLFAGFEFDEDDASAEFGITLSGVNGDKNIVKPSGNIIDLNELMGGAGL